MGPNLEVGTITMYINEKPVADLTDSKLESFTMAYPDVGDEEFVERGAFGMVTPYEAAMIDERSKISKKFQDTTWNGICKSGRWRLRKRAIEMLCFADARKESEYMKWLGIDYGR